MCIEDTALCALQPYQSLAGASVAPLVDPFKDARIWFNHLIRVTHGDMVKRENLLALMARGAAMMCAENQAGVGLLIPVVFNNQLKAENVSAILI